MKKLVCMLVSLLLAVPLLALPLLTLPLMLAGCSSQKTERCAYDLTISYNEEQHRLTGVCVFTYYNDTENEIADLKFNLYGNAYRENAAYQPISAASYAKAYYSGASYGFMEVSSVENCASWTVTGEDENLLCVTLLESVYPTQTATVTISYTLGLAAVNHRTGVTEKTVNLGNFYPVLCTYSTDGFVECVYSDVGDPFLSDCADYTVHADFPADYTVAASGTLQKQSEAGGRVQCDYTLEKARDFCFVLSKEFTVLTANVDNVTVNYYYLAEDSPQTTLTAACESLAYFNKTFGSYAYPTLSIVQTGFCYGGMEYPALCMVSDSLSPSDALYTLVHEVAHQWWYAAVGSDQLENAWQDEGLAEYSATLFFEHNPAYGYTRTGLVEAATKAYRAYYSVYNQLFGKVNTAMTRSLSSFAGEYEYVNIAYNKGMLLFEMLRKSIGDTKFLAGLKTYYQNNSFCLATPADLVAAFTLNGDDLQGFFDAFLLGKIIL